MHISTYIFCGKQYGLKHIYPCSDHFESCRGKTSHMAFANHICADLSVCMRNQNRVGTIGLPPGNQTTNCAYSDRLPFAQAYLFICCLRISSYTFVQTRTQDVSIKCTCNYEWPIDYQWYANIKCNGVIQNLWTDVSEKHFRTKSVSALHPILPVYLTILSPGLGPYSNLK